MSEAPASDAPAAPRRRFLGRLADLVDDPILLLQLRAAFRRKRFFWLQTGLLTVLALVTLVTMWGLTETYKDDTSEIGRRTFLVFLAAEVILVVYVFPAFSCTAITDERTNKSLDLLLTTKLTPERIVLGKMLAAFVYGLLFIVATLPLVALTFLFGGVTPGQIALSYGVLAVIALLVTLFALSVSSAVGSTLRSVITTYIGIFFVVVPLVAPLIDTSYMTDPWSKTWPTNGTVSGILAVQVVGPLLHEPGAVAARDAIRGFDALSTVLYWGAFAAFYTSLASLFFLVARHLLAPAGTNRSTAFRVWFAATVALALGGALVAFVHVALPGAEGPSPLSILVVTQTSLFVALVFAVIGFAAEDPLVPRRVLAATQRHKGPLAWLRAFYPGARQGERYVLWLAVLAELAIVGVFLVSLEVDGARVEGMRDGLHILEWGAAWILAFTFFLVELAVLLSCEIRQATQARLWVVVFLVFATLYPVFWFCMDEYLAKPRLYEGFFLSPWTVTDSLLHKDRELHRQLVLWGASGREVRDAAAALTQSVESPIARPDGGTDAPAMLAQARHELERTRDGAASELVIEKTLAHLERALERADEEVAAAKRQAARDEAQGTSEVIVRRRVSLAERDDLVRDLLAFGVPVHEASTVLYALVGLALWATNRRRLRRAEAEVPAPRVKASSGSRSTT